MTDDNDDGPVTAKDMLDVLRQGVGRDTVDKALREGNIEFAGCDQADALRPWVNRILQACEIDTGAYVSDESIMWDFMPIDTEERRREVRERLGVDFHPHDRVYVVAERLRDALEALDN